MNAICDDDNPKVIIRVYDYGNEVDKLKLCKNCSLDPDFSGFISETKINEVIQK